MIVALFLFDLGLGLLPKTFQVADALTLQVATKGGFDPGKAIEEAVVCAIEACFGADLAPASHVHQGEQQIPQFLLGMGPIARGLGFVDRLFELLELFVHFFPHAIEVVPLKPCGGSFLGDLRRPGQGALAAQLAGELV